MLNIKEQLDNFTQDVLANMSQVKDAKGAIDALTAMIEDANLLLGRIQTGR